MTELTLRVKYVQLRVLPISLLTAERPNTATCCEEAMILLSSFACFFTLKLCVWDFCIIVTLVFLKDFWFLFW